MSERINLSGNPVSRVWREDEWIYKQQPKYLADNEWYGLGSAYAPPLFARVDDETIKMWFIESEQVTDVKEFMEHYQGVLEDLKYRGLRHGDLTEPHVLVRDNRPVIIDWAESRTWDDPRPDKRREGDAYWLRKTMEALCQNET